MLIEELALVMNKGVIVQQSLDAPTMVKWISHPPSGSLPQQALPLGQHLPRLRGDLLGIIVIRT